MPDNDYKGEITAMQTDAMRLLLAMGSPKFCRAVVEDSPRSIIMLFNAVHTQSKYNDEIKIIAKNLVTAALANRNSFLYHENDFYSSGLEGITQPVTTALCQSPKLVRSIETLLNPEYSRRDPWDFDQWNAYFRLLLKVFSTHVRGGPTESASSLHWAFLKISWIYSDLNKELRLDDLRPGDDLERKLRLLGELIIDMVNVVNDAVKDNIDYPQHIVQDIAKLVFSLIEAASLVRKPRKVSLRIQKTLIWDEILNSSPFRGAAGRIILMEIHNLLICSVKSCPNMDSVKILGYCLNVMGFEPVDKDSQYGSCWRKIHLALIDWVKKDIATLLEKYPRMAGECFVEGMSYDKENSRLAIHYQWEDEAEDSYCYLKIDPPKPMSM
ncbi:hypothetical protein P353_24985 [Comamonas testosteroni]|uniref:Uncharacterized protein n=2 Tax=Comamonas testosteroni TaxID=285 RepID=A0A096F682_COMTE|nr:hypothetical protein P353_24985 [Comamonas testosteroni]